LPAAPSLPAPLTLLSFGALSTAAFIVLTAARVGGDVVLWENAHWTASFLTAFGVAALVAWRAPADRRPIASLFAVALGLYAAGQIVYDLQTAFGYSGYVGPADVLFLSMGLPMIAAFGRALRARVPLADERAVLLDGAMLFVGIGSAVLAVFGDPAAHLDVVTSVARLGYPIMFLAAAGGGLVAGLAARIRPAGLLILLGLTLSGLAWIAWLEQALVSPVPAGNPIDVLFSIGALTMAAGVIQWAPADRTPAGYDRIAGLLISSLPIGAVTGSVALALIAGQERGALLTVAVVVNVLLAGVRQGIRLRQRDQLLASERDASRRLVEAEARYRTLVERIPASVYLDRLRVRTGEFMESVYVSPQVEKLTGFSPDEYLADPDLWLRRIHPDDHEQVLARDKAHYVSGEALEQEYRFIRSDGREIWMHEEATVIPSGDSESILSHGFVLDITERKLLEDQLAHQAFHDSLTGLANRALFGDRLDHALARRARTGDELAVLFLDLDAFKTVNDSLGHGAGDEMLRVVAERLRGALRATDTVARLGGDEFAVLLEDIDGADAAGIAADRILDAIGGTIEIAGRSVVCRASIGIALASEDGDEASALLRNADAAMYHAKAEQRGGAVLFESGMHTAALNRFELEAELRLAIERGDLRLAYQPAVDVATREIDGVEALVRWDHPVRGPIPPLAFIDVAEQSGLIDDLGRWVLREACRQGAAWRAAGVTPAGFSLSVNVSARQLSSAVVDDVEAILAETGFPADELVLEVTESSVMHDTTRAIKVLQALRSRGIRIAVDDFGTGYSSLGSLRSLPIDVLKIDRSFVVGVESPAEAPLTETLLRLGRVLGLKTIAEGVETEAQAQALVAMGCRFAQGYLFARPLPPTELEGLLRRSAAA
jgi:diguanylate cyclase (GGDEF)-like protein/PAS domain S-box-containing protein